MPGGQYRTHGCTTSYRSIDSFALVKALGDAQRVNTVVSWQDGASIYARVDHEQVVLAYSLGGDPQRADIMLDWTPRGYGGENAFFLCPQCGGRYRKLYLYGKCFVCRRCARLNYPSQQCGDLDVARLKVRRVLKALGATSEQMKDGRDMDNWLPEKPPRMRYKTYYRYCRQLQRARQEWYALFIRAAQAILR